MRDAASSSRSASLAFVVAALLAVAGVLFALDRLLPRTWRAEARVLVQAPPEVIHSIASDLRRWPEWAQWDRSRLTTKNQLGAQTTGVGARLRWRSTGPGSSRPVTGSIRIVESDPTRGLSFQSRIEGGPPSRIRLTMSPKHGMTEVAWEDRGEIPGALAALSLDRLQQRLEAHIAEGLARLKALAEAQARTAPAPDAASEPSDGGRAARPPGPFLDAGAQVSAE